MQNNRTPRLLLCVLLSLVVHVGLAASFVSAIQLKSVYLEIVNPIQVSLVQDISDAIGTTASQSIESNLNQLSYSGTQRSSIDLNQPADNAFDTDNEVSNELDLTVVMNIDTQQSTDFAEIEQPSTPLPVVEEEMNKKLSEPEVQPTTTKVSAVSPNTDHSSEPNELESTESKIFKTVAEPIPSEHVSERLTRIAVPVTKPTNLMAYISVEDEIESRIESVNEPVSDLLQDDVSNLLVPTSSEIIADVSDADEIAGIWSSETIESVSVNFEQLPSNESTPEEIVEPAVQDKAASVAELPEPVSLPNTEIAQVTPPNIIDIELLESENSSTTSVEHKSKFVEQFTNYAPSNPIQTVYSRIDDGLDHLTDSEFQPVSDITPTENSIPREQKSADQLAEVSDADELAGIWSTEAIEPANLVFDQPPWSESTSEKTADSEIQVASISELPNSVANLTTETSQAPPPEPIDLAHLTEEVPANTSSQTAYFEFHDEVEHISEADYQLRSNIIPIETSSVPIPANSDLVADISDADELAGIWSTEVKEPATLVFDQPPWNEPTSEKTADSEIQVASISELPNSVANLTTETSQVPPPEPIDLAHLTEEVPANTSSQATYSQFNDEDEHLSEADYQLKSNIMPDETPSVPIPASSELVADISDADELAGIWSTEVIEPATIEFEPLPSNEPKSEEIEEFQSLLASTADLSEPVRLSAYETESNSQLVPTAPVTVINQVTYKTDLNEETPNAETVDLKDSLFSNQAPSATDQLAYVQPKLEPRPIREDIFARENAPSNDGIQLESSLIEDLSEANGVEANVVEPITNQQVKVPESTQKNQPEVDDSSPSNTHVSPDLPEVTENERISIPKERQQVASVDPVRQTVRSNDQGTANHVTQEASLGGISADERPKYGVESLPNQAPRYPYRSRANNEQGRVILRVIVDRKGRAKEVTVLQSSGYSRLDKAARKAVKRWRFQPAQKDGQSIQGVVQVPINFVLDSS